MKLDTFPAEWHCDPNSNSLILAVSAFTPPPGFKGGNYLITIDSQLWSHGSLILLPRTDIPPHGHYRVSQTSPSGCYLYSYAPYERWTKSDLYLHIRKGALAIGHLVLIRTLYYPNHSNPKWNFTVVGAGALIQRPNITLVADGAPPQPAAAPAPTLAEDEDEDTQFASAVMLEVMQRARHHPPRVPTRLTTLPEE